jgi:hypothetical protein
MVYINNVWPDLDFFVGDDVVRVFMSEDEYIGCGIADYGFDALLTELEFGEASDISEALDDIIAFRRIMTFRVGGCIVQMRELDSAYDKLDSAYDKLDGKFLED